MILLYNIAIRIYYVCIYVYSFFNAKAKKWIIGRNNMLPPKFISIDKELKPIWFHCASVGEYEQALPLIEYYKLHEKSTPILVTFFSPSGYEYASQKYPEEIINYLPLDTASNMKAFIDAVNPKMVFIIKYEFWYHLLHQLYVRQIPIFLVSGIFRKEQLFFTKIGFFYKRLLTFFTHLFVQNEESKQLLKTINIHHVTVMGDTRFDQVLKTKNTVFEDEIISNFIGKNSVFVAGSIWNSDKQVLKEIIYNLPKEYKIILAPHEIDGFNFNELQQPISYYSNPSIQEARILILDTMGILSKVYRVAKLAYIGGGFDKGIHNCLEAAVYEIPVLIGPQFQKFYEAKELLSLGALFEISTENIANLLKILLTDEKKYSEIKKRLNTYISANTNVSDKIAVYINTNLNR